MHTTRIERFRRLYLGNTTASLLFLWTPWRGESHPFCQWIRVWTSSVSVINIRKRFIMSHLVNQYWLDQFYGHRNQGGWNWSQYFNLPIRIGNCILWDFNHHLTISISFSTPFLDWNWAQFQSQSGWKSPDWNWNCMTFDGISPHRSTNENMHVLGLLGSTLLHPTQVLQAGALRRERGSIEIWSQI